MHIESVDINNEYRWREKDLVWESHQRAEDIGPLFILGGATHRIALIH